MTRSTLRDPGRVTPDGLLAMNQEAGCATLVAADFYAGRGERVDGLVYPAERGSYFTLLRPTFAVAAPHPLTIRFPLAYPVARHDVEWARFLGIQIDLQRVNGTIQALYDHWILGRHARPWEPHWSVIRNVLHWVN